MRYWLHLLTPPINLLHSIIIFSFDMVSPLLLGTSLHLLSCMAKMTNTISFFKFFHVITGGAWLHSLTPHRTFTKTTNTSMSAVSSTLTTSCLSTTLPTTSTYTSFFVSQCKFINVSIIFISINISLTMVRNIIQWFTGFSIIDDSTNKSKGITGRL